MDPFTTATAFSTIVGLICNFKSQHQSNDKTSYDELLLWLENSNYNNELKLEIQSNKQLKSGLELLLSNSNKEIMTKLQTIESSMSAVSSHMDGFKEISKALTSHNKLSKQAFSILKQFYDSGGNAFLEMNYMDGTTAYAIMEGGRGNDLVLDISESVFINEDFIRLRDLALLRLEHNSSGEKVYYFTRAAEQLILSSNE